MTRLLLTFLTTSIFFPAQAQSRRADVTVLMIPARHGAVQIGRDLEERESVLLMTYDPATPASTPFLHVWRGDAWLNMPANVYAAGSFLRNQPARVIVVGPANPLVSRLVEEATVWSPREVLNLQQEDPVELMNAFGRLFDFRPRDWKWFAARYQLQLEDLNEGQPRLSWYDTYVASELPPPTSPFRRRRDTDADPGLRPIIRLEPVPEEPVESSP